MRWTVDSGASGLLCDGEARFLLADTVWNGLTTPSEREWEEHLRLRRRQGFNALLVNALPDGLAPAEVDLARCRARLRMAHGLGLSAMIVLLWNDRLPGTWNARADDSRVLTSQQAHDFVRRAASAYRTLDPIFLVSGDDDFTSSAANRWYPSLIDAVRQEAPEALVAMHTMVTPLPFEVLRGQRLDLWTYQSGHDRRWLDQTRELAEHYLKAPYAAPILNIEPAYEGHGWGSGRGRHRRADVRRAAWSSVLAGASAGIGYGAHGVWSWYRSGQAFAGEGFSGMPFDAQSAAHFPGAEDYGFLREIVERHDLIGMRPSPAIHGPNPSGAQAARTREADQLAIYAPHPFAIDLLGAVGASAVRYDLETRRAEQVPLLPGRDGVTRVPQGATLSDAVYVVPLVGPPRDR